jgi:NAD(P)-dependent dehydrogenase (short-subunit alcohol dehydrogenase family)
LHQGKRTAAVTGAARGIGRRVAEVLAERGYRLALNDLAMPDETMHSILSRGGEVIGYAGNIADELVVEEFVLKVYDAWGRTDVLVNNAGISSIAPAENISADVYRKVLDVNLVAPFLLAKAFGKRMLAAKQRVQALIDRPDADARRGMGPARHTRERRLPRLGQDGDGRRRSGRWKLHRCGHHRARTNGTICNA